MHAFFRGGGGQAEQAGNVLVFFVSAVVVVFRPGRGFGRTGAVVADDVGQEDSVGAAMHGVEEAAQFVRQRVRDAEEGVSEGHARHGGGVVHFFARLEINVFHRAFEVGKNESDGLQGKAVGVVVGQC